MTDRKALTENDREELIAYLDGELDEKGSQAWEARLMLEPAVRAEADALKRTWDLLEYAPKPPAPSPTFTSRTLDRLAVIKPRENTLWADLRPMRSGWGVLWAAGLLLAFLLGYTATSGPRQVNRQASASLAAKAQSDAPTQQLAADLRVVENLQVYENAEDIEFIQELEKLELFADES
jgi:anti-sigma factor RsiW